MMWDILAFISLTILLFIASVFAFMYRQKYIKMVRIIAQLVIDKDILTKKLDEQLLLSSKEVNDGFVKFLSESREAAFTYIEDVQVSILNYMKAIESNDDEAILIARMELFSHLPENMENENKDNQQ